MIRIKKNFLSFYSSIFIASLFKMQSINTKYSIVIYTVRFVDYYTYFRKSLHITRIKYKLKNSTPDIQMPTKANIIFPPLVPPFLTASKRHQLRLPAAYRSIDCSVNKFLGWRQMHCPDDGVARGFHARSFEPIIPSRGSFEYSTFDE